MRKSNNYLNTMALTADVLSTLGGGISEPQVKLYEFTDSHRLEIKVPGVKPESLVIEINNNWLDIFHLMQLSVSGSVAAMPRVIFHKPVPYFVDVDTISATFEADKLIMTLPFNKRAMGYSRKIEIRGV